MDGKTLIDDVLTYHELQDPADTENAKLRAQILRNAQATVDEVHLAASFPYKVASVTKVFAPATTSITLDADYQSIGHDGAVHAVIAGQTIKPPLTWVPPHDMKRFQAMGEIRDRPLCYSEGPTTTAGLATILLYPFVNANCSVLVDYDTVSPTITDAVGTGSGLPKIPVQYHRTVIYAGTVMRQMRDKGDLRSAGEQKQDYDRGLKDMIRAEITGKAATKRMPVYRGARRHYR